MNNPDRRPSENCLHQVPVPWGETIKAWYQRPYIEKLPHHKWSKIGDPVPKLAGRVRWEFSYWCILLKSLMVQCTALHNMKYVHQTIGYAEVYKNFSFEHYEKLRMEACSDTMRTTGNEMHLWTKEGNRVKRVCIRFSADSTHPRLADFPGLGKIARFGCFSQFL